MGIIRKNISCNKHINVIHVCLMLYLSQPTHLLGRKTDVWYAIDLETGIKQQTLRLDGTETVCPLMSNKEAPIFLGRTGGSIIVTSLCSC